MAVVVSIARGHDASYPFKTIGAADGATITGERGAGYYLSAVEKGGEPAGTWVGNGAAELGFGDGDTVRREDFEPLYGQFLDPRDTSGQTHLGSPPRVNAELAALYQEKLAAHPGATADERMRLLAEARAEYEGPVGVQYFDTTFSVDKTISLAHASARRCWLLCTGVPVVTATVPPPFQLCTAARRESPGRCCSPSMSMANGSRFAKLEAAAPPTTGWAGLTRATDSGRAGTPHRSMKEHRESIRAFLAMIDPNTAYIGDN
jgi:hypothetical protein